MRECVDVIRAAAQISAFSKAKICIERQANPPWPSSPPSK
jgi:hypothetical protein